MAWLCAVGFSLQLYFDFHGCSLMAVGLGRMMGFRLPDNFNFPYLSRSVGEFYRRWHITLGAWFRDYVYIPLGGSRKGMGRTLLHLLVVWLLTGLWHGIGGNFLLWGLFLCFWICLEKLGLRRILDRVPVLGHIYLPIVIVLSWVIFAVQKSGRAGRLFLADVCLCDRSPGELCGYRRLYAVFGPICALFDRGLDFCLSLRGAGAEAL